MTRQKPIIVSAIVVLLLLALPLWIALAQSGSLEEQLAALLSGDTTNGAVHGDSIDTMPLIIDVNVTASGQAYFTFYDQASGDYFMAVRGTDDALLDLASQGYFSVHEEPALFGLTTTLVPDQQHWTVDPAAPDPMGSGLIVSNVAAALFTEAWQMMYGTEPPALGMPGTTNEYDPSGWTIIRTDLDTYTPPGSTPVPPGTLVPPSTGTPRPPEPTRTPRPTPTPRPTATPMPTPEECPPESISQQPPSAIILDASPPNPVVVGQGGKGLDITVRAVSYPVIHRWWTREREWVCQWWDVDTYGVPHPNNGRGCCPEDQQLPGGGCGVDTGDCWWVPGDWECVEHSEAIPDPILMDYFVATAFLRQSSIEWIQTDLASKYPGAEVKHPNWYIQPNANPVLLANGVCVVEGTAHFGFEDPGWYDVSIHGQTAGTIYTPPRSFGYTMPTPQPVYLMDTMLIR